MTTLKMIKKTDAGNKIHVTLKVSDIDYILIDMTLDKESSICRRFNISVSPGMLRDLLKFNSDIKE